LYLLWTERRKGKRKKEGKSATMFGFTAGLEREEGEEGDISFRQRRGKERAVFFTKGEKWGVRRNKKEKKKGGFH